MTSATGFSRGPSPARFLFWTVFAIFATEAALMLAVPGLGPPGAALMDAGALSLLLLPVLYLAVYRPLRLQMNAAKRREEELRESEAKYRAYVSQAPDGVFVADSHGRYVDANDAACRMTGYSREQLLGMSIPQLAADPEDPRAFATLRESGRFSGELRLRRRDGSSVPVALDAVPLSDHRYMAFCKDITERKRAEEALRLSEERFRISLKSSSITVSTQDQDLRYTWVYNPHPELSAGSVLGKTDADLVPPEDAAVLTTMKRRVLETGVGTRQTVRFTVEGQSRLYDLTLEPMRDYSGAVVGITGAATDITERDEAEVQLASFFSVVPDLLCVTSPKDGRLTKVNPACLTILGYSEEEMCSRPFAEFIHPDDREATAETVARQLAGDPVAYFENRYRHKDGSYR